MTTNPFLIQSTLNGDRAFWAERLAAIPQDLKGDEKVYALMQCVTGYYAEQTRPIFEKGVPGEGYVCAQTNPNKTGDAEYMIEQAKILASWAPNIVVKMPATNAGIKAYEECAALGLNVAATVSFTVPQVLAVGEAAARGKERAKQNGIKPGLTIAVLMCGRRDDYLRDVAHDSGAAVSESDITQAGIACLKKAYRIFNERGYDAVIMPAGLRGAYHLTEMAGGKLLYTINTRVQDMILAADPPQEERISNPVPQDILDQLRKIPEFVRVYEPDGMKPSEFITYGVTQKLLSQFNETGWAPLESKAIAAECEKAGIHMMDAPVSGGEPKAVDGTLSIMCGGPKALFDKYFDLLKVMGASVVHCGDVNGAGNTVKLANQIIVACNIAACAEAYSLSTMAGVNPEKVFAAIRGGLAGSTVMDAKVPMMMDGNFKPGFKIDLHIKDLNNALDTGHGLGTPMLLTAQVREMLQWLHNNGDGQSDHSAILKYYERITGVEVRK